MIITCSLPNSFIQTFYDLMWKGRHLEKSASHPLYWQICPKLCYFIHEYACNRSAISENLANTNDSGPTLAHRYTVDFTSGLPNTWSFPKTYFIHGYTLLFWEISENLEQPWKCCSTVARSAVVLLIFINIFYENRNKMTLLRGVEELCKMPNFWCTVWFWCR